MYQVIVPDGKGRSPERVRAANGGYLEAGRQGMYDELDFICPVLYQRFGPDDANPERVRRWIERLPASIEQSLTLTRTDDAPVPLVPILSFWVFNPRSANYRRPSPPSRGRQLQIVQAATGVAAILSGRARRPGRDENGAQARRADQHQAVPTRRRHTALARMHLTVGRAPHVHTRWVVRQACSTSGCRMTRPRRAASRVPITRNRTNQPAHPAKGINPTVRVPDQEPAGSLAQERSLVLDPR